MLLNNRGLVARLPACWRLEILQEMAVCVIAGFFTGMVLFHTAFNAYKYHDYRTASVERRTGLAREESKLSYRCGSMPVI